MPAHIEGNQRMGAGWPEFAGSKLVAAAGVWEQMVSGQESMGWGDAGGYGFVEMR